MNNEINIEKIMKEIKNAIKEKNYVDDIVSFDEIPIRETLKTEVLEESLDSNTLKETMHYLNSSYKIEPYKSITSNKKVIGKIIVFAKKIIRKMIKFYIEPIMEEQSHFNAHVTRFANQMFLEIVEDENLRVSAQEVKRIREDMELIKLENERLKNMLKKVIDEKQQLL